MGRRYDFRMLDELEGDRIFRRFLHKDVERGSAAVAGLERVQESLLVDDAAARHVNDVHAFLALRQGRRVDQVCEQRI